MGRADAGQSVGWVEPTAKPITGRTQGKPIIGRPGERWVSPLALPILRGAAEAAPTGARRTICPFMQSSPLGYTQAGIPSRTARVERRLQCPFASTCWLRSEEHTSKLYSLMRI